MKEAVTRATSHMMGALRLVFTCTAMTSEEPREKTKKEKRTRAFHEEIWRKRSPQFLATFRTYAARWRGFNKRQRVKNERNLWPPELCKSISRATN